MSTWLILFLLATFLSSFNPRDKGPSYAGKSLSKWVTLLGRRYWENPPSPELRSTAEQAIAHIGTNAIPFLLQWIPYEPSGSRVGRRLASMARKLPGPPRFQFLADPVYRPTDEMRARGSRNAFHILGPAASPAIPALSNLIAFSQSEVVKERIADALANIGPVALPAMINLLTNSNDTIFSINLAYAILSLGTSAEPAIPAILHSVTNSHWGRTSAEKAFEQLSSQSQAFADALVALRKSEARAFPPPEISYEFSGNSPVPFLVATLKSSDPALRLAATNALLKIAPEALTNPPPR